MKKILVSILAVMLCAISFMACGDTTVYTAVKAEDVELEQYGFCISNTHEMKDTYITAMNEVIAELQEDDSINALVTYHTNIYNGDDDSLDFTVPDTSDNTGGTLTVALNAAFAPYEYTLDGITPQGVDVDMMHFVGEKLNLKVEIYNMAFAAALTGVQNKNYDVGASGITITEERQETMIFSDPYYESTQYIIMADGLTYANISDLKGLKIGVQLGTTGDLFCQNALKTAAELSTDEEVVEEDGSLYGSGASVLQYENGPTAFVALKSGKIDVIVIDELPAQSIVKNQ